MARNVILLSGGLDSVALAYALTSQGECLRALHFNVGRYSTEREIHAAKYIAHDLDIPIDVVEMQGIQRMLRGYMDPELTRAGEFDTQCAPELTPALFSVGAFYAQVTGGSKLFVGLTKEQADGRPHLSHVLSLIGEAASLYDPTHPTAVVDAPFLGMTKSEIVKHGLMVNAPLSQSWSCVYDMPIHCGKCDRCKERKDAFTVAGFVDPTQYAT